MAKLNIWLTIFLVVAIVASIGCIIYLANTPKPGDRFTEFYILGPERKASGYPKEIVLGESAEIFVGIANHEGKPTSYRATLTIDDDIDQEVHVGMLSDGAEWEQKVSFTPKKAGNQQKVELNLYKGASDQAYHKEPLRLFVDVIPQ
jgi:uncharacterized membrane protein